MAVPNDCTTAPGFLTAGELVVGARVEVRCKERGSEWAAATVLQLILGDASIDIKPEDAGETLQDAWVRCQLLSGTIVDVEYFCCRRPRSYLPAAPSQSTHGMVTPSRDLPPYHSRVPRSVEGGKVKRI